MIEYKLNEKTAELIGAHIGDGTLYKTKFSLVWELRGGLDEKEYYTQNICPLLEEIFSTQIKSKFRSGGKNGCWGVQTTNKNIIHFFLQNGFEPGSKTYFVKIPQKVMSANDKIKKACIRGLIDTDGCLRFDRIKKHKERSYPRIEFTSASEELRNQLKSLLTELGFKVIIWTSGTYFKLGCNGKKMLSKWIREIGFGNPKHLKRHAHWLKNGFY